MCEQSKLMYREELERLAVADSCPCGNCQEVKDLEAFRYMYEPLSNPDNFLPQLLKAEKEGRVVRGYLETPDKICDAMALSFFLSAHFALAQYKALKGFPRLNPRYTVLGKCRLTEQDGVASPANSNGHFNVHPYEEAPMQNTFESFESLAL
ncbi:MAG: hypothetical protein EOO61_14730 [Hymenobacter sp.]|nr:MAG: hypothetical protein EOO61_14730 [Hymenobacter sp.]